MIDVPVHFKNRTTIEEERFFMWYWYVVTGVLALLAGVAIGFFIARKYMENYLKNNPPINEQMLKVMMAQMGQKPSQKKINQMMSQMNKLQKKE